MSSVTRQIMSRRAADAQIGAFLIALEIKGETIDEISSAAQVIRDLVESVIYKNKDLVDLVGTRADSANLFNVSTGASFVIAALSQKLMLELTSFAKEVNLDIFIEVRNRAELDRDLELGTEIIRII